MGGPRNRMTLSYLTVTVCVLALWIYWGHFSRSQPGLARLERPNVKQSSADGILKKQHVEALLPMGTRNTSSSQYSVDHNARSGRRLCRAHAGICKETFLYMVQGEENPAQFWMKVGRRTDSFLIWLSWRRPSNWSKSGNPVGDGGGMFDSTKSLNRPIFLFLPKSSFTVGRNRLLEEAKLLESRLGWKFEFFVFSDEDSTHFKIENSDRMRNEFTAGEEPWAISYFNNLLVKYRPARAGVLINLQHMDGNVRCFITSGVDAAFEAYHRTAVDALLPYIAKFDRINIWISGSLQNLKTKVLFPDKAVRFQIRKVLDLQEKHSNYPKIGSWKMGVWQRIHQYLSKCLPQGAVKARSLLTGPDKYQHIKASFFREVGRQPCPQPGENVDYSRDLEKAFVAQNWVTEGSSCGDDLR